MTSLYRRRISARSCVTTLIILFVSVFILRDACSISVVVPWRKSNQNTDHFPSMTLVVASIKSQDTTWIQKYLSNIQTVVYRVDDPDAEFKPPRNKGREAMVYLTYIIDNYYSLSDVSVFIHAQRFARHNEELLDDDMVRSIKSLRYDRVLRDGYFNLRCSWDHGCPDWLDLKGRSDNLSQIIYSVWNEIHNEPMPETLAQPWGGQFAVSRERIQSVPFVRWINYRDWLLKTHLSDQQSGRVWEYIWQYVFTRSGRFCPNMQECYCDGYGICFDGSFQAWWDKWRESKEWFAEYLRIKAAGNDSRELSARYHLRNDDLKRELEEAVIRGDHQVRLRTEAPRTMQR